MTQRYGLLINGWGMPEFILKPLQDQLQQQGLALSIVASFDHRDANVWSQQLQQALDCEVLMGWSMGGQLATLLANACYTQTGQAKSLITLASNPQFVQSDDWPQAMTFAQFQEFQRRFSTRPEQTLKRFKHLIMQGENTQFHDRWALLSNELNHHVLSLEVSDLTLQLDLLGQLQTQAILKDYAGKQLHIFAANDVIVPLAVAQQVQALVVNSAQLSIAQIADASHAFVYSHEREIAEKINAFLADTTT